MFVFLETYFVSNNDMVELYKTFFVNLKLESKHKLCNESVLLQSPQKRQSVMQKIGCLETDVIKNNILPSIAH